MNMYSTHRRDRFARATDGGGVRRVELLRVHEDRAARVGGDPVRPLDREAELLAVAEPESVGVQEAIRRAQAAEVVP